LETPSVPWYPISYTPYTDDWGNTLRRTDLPIRDKWKNDHQYTPPRHSFGRRTYSQPPQHSWDTQTEQPNLTLPLYSLYKVLGSSPVPSFSGIVAGGFTPHSHHTLNQQQPSHYQENFLSQLKKVFFLGASPWGGHKPHQYVTTHKYRACDNYYFTTSKVIFLNCSIFKMGNLCSPRIKIK